MVCFEERCKYLFRWLLYIAGVLALLLLAIGISADVRSTGVNAEGLREAAYRLPGYTHTSLSTVSSLAYSSPRYFSNVIAEMLSSSFTNLSWRSAALLFTLILVLRCILSLLKLALELLILAVVFSVMTALVSLSDLVALNHTGLLQPSRVGVEYSRLIGSHWQQVKDFGAHHLVILALAVLLIFLLRQLRAKFQRAPEVSRFTEIWT